MVNPIKLKKAMLFDCNIVRDSSGQEINVANPVGSVFNLDPIPPNLETFNSTIGFNIMKKLDALESNNLAKKESKVSPLTNRLPLPITKGRKPVAINFDINNNEFLEEMLNSSSDMYFKQKTTELANKYVGIAKNPKGILGFVLFELKINGRIQKFIAILITYYHETLSPDSSTAVKLLDKAFDKQFKDIIFYPRLVSVSDSAISVSRSEVKSYSVIKANPDLLKTFDIKDKIHPQKKLKKVYDNLSGKVSKFEDLASGLGNEAKFAEIEILIDEENKLKVPLLDFIEKFKILYSKKGEGILVEGGKVKILIGNKEIRSDWISKNSLFLEDINFKKDKK